MKWCDRSLWQCRYHFGLCLTEKDFFREMKKMGVPRGEWPRWVSDSANATTHFLNHPDGAKAAIVCMPVNDSFSGVQQAALLVHEAVHIWQEHCDDIGEREPGSESEAYAVQSISQRLMEAYVDAMK